MRAFGSVGLRAATSLAILAAIAVADPSPARAQSSPSHALTGQVFNAGGHPAQAVTAASPSFRLSLDSIGEPLAGGLLGSASFRMDGGLAAGYLPPGEVGGLQLLADRQTLVWSLEPASAAYNVYTGLLSTLPGTFGACSVARVIAPTATDASTPSPGTGLFYLVTGVNRLREEGTKGRVSSGAERINPLPCP